MHGTVDPARVTRVESRVLELEDHFKPPVGAIPVLQSRVEDLENRRVGTSVTFGGGITFKDEKSTQAWFLQLKDDEAYMYAPDMMALLSVAEDSFETIADGMKVATDVSRAEFKTPR